MLRNYLIFPKSRAKRQSTVTKTPAAHQWNHKLISNALISQIMLKLNSCFSLLLSLVRIVRWCNILLSPFTIKHIININYWYPIQRMPLSAAVRVKCYLDKNKGKIRKIDNLRETSNACHESVWSYYKYGRITKTKNCKVITSATKKKEERPEFTNLCYMCYYTIIICI